MTIKNKLKASGLFYSGGGMSCGLRQVGIKVIAGINFADGEFHYRDDSEIDLCHRLF